ncbi:MAG: S1C family serine protease [Candidatus Dormibacteria bacterium]
MTRRGGVLAGAAVLTACAVFGVTRGQLAGGGTPRADEPGALAAPSGSPGDVTAGVVNINGRVPEGVMAGTGMILTDDGIVLTNNHVVAGTDALVAQFAGQGQVYRATVLGVDPSHDVAVIRLVGASHLPTVPIETSGAVATGDHVTGMGNALGKNGSPVVATGVVTGLDETLEVSADGNRLHTTLNGLIKFTAPIQPGDSGGPLINDSGRVIGMDTAGSFPDHGAGFGAAIPISAALAIADQIRAGVTSAYIQSGHSGTLGIAVVDGPSGPVVSRVVHGDAGAGAGIAAGNVVLAVGGVAVHTATECDAAAAGHRPGDRLSVGWRDSSGAQHLRTVVLSSGPPA